MSATTASADWRSILQSGLLARYAVLCAGIWLHAASTMLVATTLPSAVEAIGGAHLVGWAFALYQLGSIVAGAATALIAARLGLRAALLVATGTYAAGCMVCALAPTMEMLLAGRLVQGAGGGALVALTYVALNQMFPRAMMPRLIAVMSAFWSASAFCGPMVGGGFATLGLWRYAFWAFVVQAAVMAVMVVVFIPAVRTDASARVGSLPVGRLAVLAGAILAVALAGAVFRPIGSPLLCLLAVGLLGLFLSLDRRSGDLRMFPSDSADPRTVVGAGLVLVLCASTATMTFLVYGTFLLESLFDLTPLTAGYVVALESVGWGTAAVALSGAGPRTERWLIRTGPLLVLASVFGLGFAFYYGSLVAVLVFAPVQGAAFGMMWGFVVRRVVAVAPPADRDRASSALPTTQQIGFALGAGAAGLMANAVGLLDGGSAETVRAAAFWPFVAFVPLVLVANVAAWRLSR